MEFDESGNEILNAEEIYDLIDGVLRAQMENGKAITVINLLGALRAMQVKAEGLFCSQVKV